MAHVLLLTDTQLERICERSEGLCGNNCMRLEAFQSNLRYNCVIMMAIWKAISMTMMKFHKKG